MRGYVQFAIEWNFSMRVEGIKSLNISSLMMRMLFYLHIDTIFYTYYSVHILPEGLWGLQKIIILLDFAFWAKSLKFI